MDLRHPCSPHPQTSGGDEATESNCDDSLIDNENQLTAALARINIWYFQPGFLDTLQTNKLPNKLPADFRLLESIIVGTKCRLGVVWSRSTSYDQLWDGESEALLVYEYSVGNHCSIGVDEGRKLLNYSRHKKTRIPHVVSRGKNF